MAAQGRARRARLAELGRELRELARRHPEGSAFWHEAAAAMARAVPYMDREALARATTLAWGLGLADQGDRQGAKSAKAFAEGGAAWGEALAAFVGKQALPAADMEAILGKLESVAGIDPAEVQRRAYDGVFTLVREADRQVLLRVDQLIAKAIGEGMSPGDFTQDMNDLYRSLGLREQDAWYARLVYSNAVNRAWQEGRDALSHDWVEGRGWVPKDWVWGYLWEHGSSEHPRPTHLAMNGHAAPVGASVWGTFGPPPIAHNCSCARHTLSLAEAEARGLAGRGEPPEPTVKVQDLKAAGLDRRAARELAGRPVSEAIRDPRLAGDRFARSTYNTPGRPLINPSGLGVGPGRDAGAVVPPGARAVLERGDGAGKLLNDVARAKGWRPGLEASMQSIAKDIAGLKHEVAYILDDDGGVLEQVIGSRSEVLYTDAQRAKMNNNHVIHNHPNHLIYASGGDHALSAETNRKTLAVAATVGEKVLLRIISRPGEKWPFSASQADWASTVFKMHYDADAYLRGAIYDKAAGWSVEEAGIFKRIYVDPMEADLLISNCAEEVEP